MTIGMIREIARAEMSGKRLLLTVGFVLCLVSWTIVEQVYETIFGFQNVFSFFNIFIDGWDGFNWQYILFPILLVILYIVGDLLLISYRWFTLDVLEGKEVEIRAIFQVFKKENIKPVLSLVIQRGSMLLGWSLLFILPGLWKGYLYSQAPNILRDNRNLSTTEVLEKSEGQMKNHIVDYLSLQASFLPWYLAPLALLIFGIWANRSEIELAFEMGLETTNFITGFLFMSLLIVGVVLLLFALYVEPFKMVSKQVFYKELMNKEEIENENDKGKIVRF